MSAEHGIGVRHGCFCAHPLMAHLLGVDSRTVENIRSWFQEGRRPPLPGAVRASVGLPTTADHVERLLAAVAELAESGPRWRYSPLRGGDDRVADPDPRPRPAIACTAGSRQAVSLSR